MTNDLIKSNIKEKKIVQYQVGQVFFHQADPGLEVFLMFYQGSWQILTLRGWFAGLH